MIVARVRGQFQPERTAGERAKVDRGSGYRLALAHPVLRTVLIVEALFTLGFGIGIAGDAPLAEDLGTGPGGYAAIITAWGVGQVLSGLAMTRWPDRTPRADLRALGGGLALMALAMFATAALPALWQIVAVQFVGGVGMSVVYVLRSGVIQRSAPDEVRGRVFAALDAVMSAGSLGGPGDERARDRRVRRAVGLRDRGRAGDRRRRDRDRDQARISTGVPVGASFMIRRMFSFVTRMQPFEARVPIRLGALVPWMAIGLPAAQPCSASE